MAKIVLKYKTNFFDLNSHKTGTLRVCVSCYKYFSQQQQTGEGEGSPGPGNDALSQSLTGSSTDSVTGNGTISSSPSASFLPHRLSSLMGKIMFFFSVA